LCNTLKPYISNWTAEKLVIKILIGGRSKMKRKDSGSANQVPSTPKNEEQSAKDREIKEYLERSLLAEPAITVSQNVYAEETED
jgi:hypothetical protein